MLQYFIVLYNSQKLHTHDFIYSHNNTLFLYQYTVPTGNHETVLYTSESVSFLFYALVGHIF